MTSKTETVSSDLLADLVAEGKQSKRQETIARAAQRVRDADAKKPLSDGPPIRRDIYQQLEWRALSVTLITIQTHCKNCDSSFESPNSGIFVERYHRRHGRHYVEANSFNLLSREQLEALPRKIETHYAETLYCHRCFLAAQEPLCLEPTLNPIPESSPLTSAPCVPQQLAIPSQQTLWSDTFEKISKPTSELSQPSKPSGLNDKEWL